MTLFTFLRKVCKDIRAAILDSSPRDPLLCTFCMFFLSLQTFVLFEHKCPAKWTLQDSSSKWTYMFHSKCTQMCEMLIYIVFIHRGIWCHTCPCVKMLHSTNPWMNVPKWSKLQQISPAQGVGSNGHCVGTIWEHSSCTERTSNELIIWIRCVNKESHTKCAEQGGARAGIENCCIRVSNNEKSFFFFL